MFRSRLRSKAKTSWMGDWLYRPCQSRLPRRVRAITTNALEKPYYVTTPIFYVNGSPHIGHLYTMVLSDILKRWQMLKGRKSLLCTGTDEHGLKIQQAAARAEMDPGEFCDKGATVFKALAAKASILNDFFIRTTDSDHKDAVAYMWRMLEERDLIYPSKHEGWYCISDETFYPESTVEKRMNPFDGRTFMASSETGNEVEWTSEPNYHFRLSAMKEPLLQFYKDNPLFILPATRMADVVRSVSDGLEDLSVSRPVERLTWGIQVPNDESQTIYVWLDALVNYVTKAGYPWAPGSESAGGWPADVQVIGKDIVRFHCIYWPAFLLALDIPPPKQIQTHAHWTIGKQKMSKSTGNVVNPFFAIDRFGIDPLRYYLADEGGINDDSDYCNLRIAAKYKNDLRGALGNLVNRLVMAKSWSVSASVKAAHDGDLPSTGSEHKKQVSLLRELRDVVSTSFDKVDQKGALRHIMRAITDTNKHLQMTEPWILARDSGGATLPVMRIVYNTAEAIRIAGILLQPFMPEKAQKILDMLGVDKSKRTFDDALYGADFSYGTPLVTLKRQAHESVFPPLSVD